MQAYLRATLAGSMGTDQNRFNVMGEFGAVYLSLDAETPVQELRRTYQKLLGTDRPEDIATGRILITLALHLRRVADLRDPTECAAWAIAPAAVNADELGPCQAAAREVRRTFEAIRYPSATGKGENLAVFVDRLQPGSHITLLDVQPLEAVWGN
ncbi:MAG: RES family NAD+ phosphorylase [bacterium]